MQQIGASFGWVLIVYADHNPNDAYTDQRASGDNQEPLEMLVYHSEDSEAELVTKGRCHPWSEQKSDPENRYYDLKKHPEAIETQFEDIRTFPAGGAKDALVGLLKWINGSQSTIESNDCGLRPPAPSKSLGVNPKPTECRGRIVVLYRELSKNRPGGAKRLARLIEYRLRQVDADFEDGCWGWSLWPHEFSELEGDREGFAVCLHFWAWGDDGDEAQKSMERTMRNLLGVLKMEFSVV